MFADKEDAQKLSETVDEAYNLLTEYNQRLSQELLDRKENARMVRTYLNLQRDLLQIAESRLIVRLFFLLFSFDISASQNGVVLFIEEM